MTHTSNINPRPQDELSPTREEWAALRNRLDPADPEARLVWDFLSRAAFIGATTTAFDQAGAVDAFASQRNEGARALVLRLADFCDLSPFNLLKRN